MIETIDWNREWKSWQESRRHVDDSAYWDKRAPSFAKTAGTSPYARTFLECADVKPGETVFDMGCGSGTLALPLAKQGVEVWACDFSPVMIDLMMRRAELDGTAELIHPVQLSWDEDWSMRELPVCDVAFASRSIMTDDLADSLVKLDGQARRRVCITLSTGSSPRCDEVLLNAMGRERAWYADHVFAMNILWQLGKWPELSYIHSKRPSEFESFEEAIERTCEVFDATPEERVRLEAYARGHLKRAVSQDTGQPCWAFDHTRITSWAFISWDREIAAE